MASPPQGISMREPFFSPGNALRLSLPIAALALLGATHLLRVLAWLLLAATALCAFVSALLLPWHVRNKLRAQLEKALDRRASIGAVWVRPRPNVSEIAAHKVVVFSEDDGVRLLTIDWLVVRFDTRCLVDKTAVRHLSEVRISGMTIYIDKHESGKSNFATIGNSGTPQKRNGGGGGERAHINDLVFGVLRQALGEGFVVRYGSYAGDVVRVLRSVAEVFGDLLKRYVVDELALQSFGVRLTRRAWADLLSGDDGSSSRASDNNYAEEGSPDNNSAAVVTASAETSGSSEHLAADVAITPPVTAGGIAVCIDASLRRDKDLSCGPEGLTALDIGTRLMRRVAAALAVEVAAVARRQLLDGEALVAAVMRSVVMPNGGGAATVAAAAATAGSNGSISSGSAALAASGAGSPIVDLVEHGVRKVASVEGAPEVLAVLRRALFDAIAATASGPHSPVRSTSGATAADARHAHALAESLLQLVREKDPSEALRILRAVQISSLLQNLIKDTDFGAFLEQHRVDTEQLLASTAGMTGGDLVDDLVGKVTAEMAGNMPEAAALLQRITSNDRGGSSNIGVLESAFQVGDGDSLLDSMARLGTQFAETFAKAVTADDTRAFSALLAVFHTMRDRHRRAEGGGTGAGAAAAGEPGLPGWAARGLDVKKELQQLKEDPHVSPAVKAALSETAARLDCDLYLDVFVALGLLEWGVGGLLRSLPMFLPSAKTKVDKRGYALTVSNFNLSGVRIPAEALKLTLMGASLPPSGAFAVTAFGVARVRRYVRRSHCLQLDLLDWPLPRAACGAGSGGGCGKGGGGGGGGGVAGRDSSGGMGSGCGSGAGSDHGGAGCRSGSGSGSGGGAGRGGGGGGGAGRGGGGGGAGRGGGGAGRNSGSGRGGYAQAFLRPTAVRVISDVDAAALSEAAAAILSEEGMEPLPKLQAMARRWSKASTSSGGGGSGVRRHDSHGPDLLGFVEAMNRTWSEPDAASEDVKAAANSGQSRFSNAPTRPGSGSNLTPPASSSTGSHSNSPKLTGSMSAGSNSAGSNSTGSHSTAAATAAAAPLHQEVRRAPTTNEGWTLRPSRVALGGTGMPDGSNGATAAAAGGGSAHGFNQRSRDGAAPADGGIGRHPTGARSFDLGAAAPKTPPKSEASPSATRPVQAAAGGVKRPPRAASARNASATVAQSSRKPGLPSRQDSESVGQLLGGLADAAVEPEGYSDSDDDSLPGSGRRRSDDGGNAFDLHMEPGTGGCVDASSSSGGGGTRGRLGSSGGNRPRGGGRRGGGGGGVGVEQEDDFGSVELSGVCGRVPNVRWSFEQKVFPHVKDSGELTVEFVGLSVSLALGPTRLDPRRRPRGRGQRQRQRQRQRHEAASRASSAGSDTGRKRERRGTTSLQSSLERSFGRKGVRASFTDDESGGETEASDASSDRGNGGGSRQGSSAGGWAGDENIVGGDGLLFGLRPTGLALSQCTVKVEAAAAEIEGSKRDGLYNFVATAFGDVIRDLMTEKIAEVVREEVGDALALLNDRLLEGWRAVTRETRRACSRAVVAVHGIRALAAAARGGGLLRLVPPDPYVSVQLLRRGRVIAWRTTDVLREDKRQMVVGGGGGERWLGQEAPLAFVLAPTVQASEVEIRVQVWDRRLLRKDELLGTSASHVLSNCSKTINASGASISNSTGSNKGREALPGDGWQAWELEGGAGVVLISCHLGGPQASESRL